MMTKPPRVSVIVPTFNRKHILQETLQSILRQTFQDFEIIVIDDGSTDGTGEMFGIDKQIHYLYKEHNGTPAGVRNLGLRHARGEYVAFCDDDDLWLPGKLEKQVEILDKHQDLDAVGSNCIEFPGVPVPVLNYTHDHRVTFNELLHENCVFTSGLVVRMGVLCSLGGLDERPLIRTLEDYALALRITQRQDRSILILKEPLFQYRLRGTSNDLRGTSKDLMRFRDYHLRKLLLQRRAAGKGMFVTSLHILWIRVGVILEDLAGKVARRLFKRLLAASSPRVHNENKRLIIYTENYLVGGLDKFIGDLLDGSHERPVLFYNAGNTSIPRIAHIRGLQSIALPIKQAGISHNAIGRIILMFKRRLIFLRNYWTILKAFSDVGAGRVLVVNGGYPGADSCRAAILAGARVGARSNVMSVLSSPTFYHVSGSTSPAGILQRVIHTIDWVIDDLVNAAATAIHVNCTSARDEMVSFMNFHPTQVHVIPTGIEIPNNIAKISLLTSFPLTLKKHPKLNVTWVGTVGRLDPLKGVEYLIRAFSFLKWDKRIHCLIVGEGDDLDRLWEIIGSLGIEDQVLLIGKYEGDINDVYRFLDVFVCPSLHEGLPYVVEEAMAHGLPVIATRVGGIPDLVEDGVTGVLVPPADPRAIANAILRLTHKTGEVDSLMGRKARETIEGKFSMQKMVKSMEDLLK